MELKYSCVSQNEHHVTAKQSLSKDEFAFTYSGFNTAADKSSNENRMKVQVGPR